MLIQGVILAVSIGAAAIYYISETISKMRSYVDEKESYQTSPLERCEISLDRMTEQEKLQIKDMYKKAKEAGLIQGDGDHQNIDQLLETYKNIRKTGKENDNPDN